MDNSDMLMTIGYRDKLYKKNPIWNPEYGILLVNLKTYNGSLKTKQVFAKHNNYYYENYQMHVLKKWNLK